MVNRVSRLTKVFSLEQFSLTPRRVRGGPSLCVQTWAQIPLGSYDWQWESVIFKRGIRQRQVQFGENFYSTFAFPEACFSQLRGSLF